jgi:DNA-directed RNA polymerase sigma subunit (sigma70/sigma32)
MDKIDTRLKQIYQSNKKALTNIENFMKLIETKETSLIENLKKTEKELEKLNKLLDDNLELILQISKNCFKKDF